MAYEYESIDGKNGIQKIYAYDLEKPEERHLVFKINITALRE